jgi:oligopeptide transport system substrate-binding protein
MCFLRPFRSRPALGLLAVFAWASSANAQAPKSALPADTFTFRVLSEPSTLDWNRAHTVVENYLLTNLMEGLVELDEKLQVRPALAESFTRSPDGKKWTYRLRANAKWSDGVPLRAQDFVHSWKRLLTAATGASYAYLLFDVVNAEAYFKGEVKDFAQVGVVAKDDRTLEVTLARPVSYWQYIPSFWVTYPLREDVVAKHGAGWARPGKMVTVGAYTLAAHEVDSRIVFDLNPHYWGQRGNVKKVVAQIVKDDSTALTLYEAGKLDYLTDIPSLDLKRLAGRADLRSFPYLKTGYLGFSTNVEAVRDARVRRAIAMAIDKSKFGELLHGGQKAASSFLPPLMPGYDAKVGLPFDPVRARKELEAAGVKPDSLTVSMTIPNWERPTTIAQYVQSELKKNLGLNVTVQPFDHKAFRAQLNLHKFASYVLSWSADYPDPDNFMAIFEGDAGNNRTTWKNARYDELVTQARLTAGAAERKRLYAEAQRILLEKDAVIVPLYHESNLALVNPRVKGFALSPINYFYIRKVNLGR